MRVDVIERKEIDENLKKFACWSSVLLLRERALNERGGSYSTFDDRVHSRANCVLDKCCAIPLFEVRISFVCGLTKGSLTPQLSKKRRIQGTDRGAPHSQRFKGMIQPQSNQRAWC